MRGAATALAAILTGLLVPALAHAGAPAGCRHPLAPAASVDAIPPAVTAPLTWIAFHGEHWNSTDVVTPGARTGLFLWAARSGADWIVAYKVGGIACCSTRFTLLLPKGGAYAPVTPAYPSKTDWFGDAGCAGIDAALSAYAGGR